MPQIPSAFPWGITSEAYAKGVVNAVSAVRSDHLEHIEESLNYIFGKHQRVYPCCVLYSGSAGMHGHDFTGDGVDAHALQIYVEPDVDYLVVWVLAQLVANEYTLTIDANGTDLDLVFPTGDSKVVMAGYLPVAAGWNGIEITGTPTAPGAAELQVIELMFWGMQLDSY